VSNTSGEGIRLRSVDPLNRWTTLQDLAPNASAVVSGLSVREQSLLMAVGTDGQSLLPASVGRQAFEVNTEGLLGVGVGLGADVAINVNFGFFVLASYQRSFVSSSQVLADYYPSNTADFASVMGQVGLYVRLIRSRELL